ncbi:DNA mismatch repair protein msh6 [Astathelohania contejeani]|uniref:DNA mismatch repair protein msh6 n=1 Tax=Astathelohania contejeani TaxID=164912 RepID=A0ABQ7I087_9MICR|nr:DNA mismatch repair protein msh6 [Thelohania contejeani]
MKGMNKKKNLLDYFSSPIKKQKTIEQHPMSAIDDNQECSLNSDYEMSSVGEIIEKENKQNYIIKEENKPSQRFEFLIDIRDKNGIRKGEPGYDPSTLYIPNEAYLKFTPFEKQFWDIKREYYDTVVCFKKGKFYELYENDADIGAKLFDMKLTDRVNMKMAGFPESNFDYWAGRFLEKGFKIARVDQAENMIGKTIREREENSKKSDIIQRELKEVITQGTIYNQEHLKTPIPIYLCVIRQTESCFENECKATNHVSILLFDASINKVYYATFCEDSEYSNLRTIFAKYQIKEIITDLKIKLDFYVNLVKPIKGGSYIKLKGLFHNESEYQCFLYLKNYLEYLKRGNSLDNIDIEELNDIEGNYMILDGITLRNMEILYNISGGEENSLFSSINYCISAFGQRMLRKWLINPLRDKEKIEKRQRLSEKIGKLDLHKIRTMMKSIGDVERILGRLFNGNPTAKDIFSLISNLRTFNSIINFMKEEGDEEINHNLLNNYPNIEPIIDEFTKLYSITENEISPIPGKEDPELKEFLEEKKNIEKELNDYINSQRKILRAPSIKYKDLGKELFQLEVPLNIVVPKDYLLVSSTKTTRRFYTFKLKEIVNRFMENEEKIFQNRALLLKNSIGVLTPHLNTFYQAINIIAEIDCYCSFSIYSQINPSFTFPSFGNKLKAVGLKNPIHSNYIENELDFTDEKILVLTGPNMGGKSTLLRSICLNIILAQVGLKVACTSLKTILFDRIFTRIGASDNLIRGESTFMVEMIETSKILNESTSFSFVIIDELGRGTSTIDGECIARAVLEEMKKKENYVLFSTHYHSMVETVKGVKKGYMDVLIENDELVFKYKLVDGVCKDSLGVYVARLAGVPEEIVKRAINIKKRLK